MPRITRVAGAVADRDAANKYGLVVLLLMASYVTSVSTTHEGGAIVVMLVQLVTLYLTFSASESRKAQRIAGIACVVMGVVAVATFGFGVAFQFDNSVVKVLAIVSVVLYLVAPLVILRHLLNRQVVDARTILGAISIYLMLGMMFAFSYRALSLWQTDPFFGANGRGDSADFLFFSFIRQVPLLKYFVQDLRRYIPGKLPCDDIRDVARLFGNDNDQRIRLLGNTDTRAVARAEIADDIAPFCQRQQAARRDDLVRIERDQHCAVVKRAVYGKQIDEQLPADPRIEPDARARDVFQPRLILADDKRSRMIPCQDSDRRDDLVDASLGISPFLFRLCPRSEKAAVPERLESRTQLRLEHD